MRILLKESAPSFIGPLSMGKAVATVQRKGWASIKNAKLLALAAGEFEVLLTADKGMEDQQTLAALPVSILTVIAPSNRLEGLAAAVPANLATLAEPPPPRTLRRVTARDSSR